MSDIKLILQWVAISSKEDETIITHQFKKDGSQRNIKFMLDLAEEDKLGVLVGIPIDQRIGTEFAIGNPFVAVDMKTGMFNVNGTNWNFMPTGIDSSSVKFRPIWFHTIKKDYAMTGMKLVGERITQYKIGWQFTHEEKNYQRIVFFNVETGIFSLKEKR